MLLDLGEWFLLIKDGIDLVFSNLASGTYPIPLSFVLVFLLFGLISVFGWRSTDIPDLPPAPRPPYVIQITAGPGSGGVRQTINDVRLLSGGVFFDGSEILTRYQNISRNQATNTNTNAQPSTSGTSVNRNADGRGSSGEAGVGGQNFRRRLPGRSLLLGLFRRPNALARPVPAISNTIRAQLGSPNVVVYHRVNVYHHHIHSHPPGSSGGNPPGSNPTSSPNANLTASSSSTSSSQPTPSASSSQLPESSSTSEPSPLVEDAQLSSATPFNSNGVSDRNLLNVDNIEDTTIESSNSFSAVHNIANPTPLNSSTSDTMPARSGGDSSQQPSNDDACGGSGTANLHQASVNANEPPQVENDVRFTIKFLNDTQMDVTSQLNEKIADFKRRHFATEMSENKTVRLIFNGRVLDNDNKTLREFGIFDQCVVHCLIVNRQPNQDQSRNAGMPATGRNNNAGLADGVQGNVRRIVGLPEPGMFFVAFIGIFLIFLWFICLHFGQHLFTQSAVVSLTVLTAIFLIGIVACYLPLPTN